MKSIVASQAKPKEKKTKQIKGVFEKNGGLIYPILAFILLGQNVMAIDESYPVQIYPPDGYGAVTNNGSYYGLPQPILVLKANMSGVVAFKVETTLIKADERPYDSFCLPTPPKEVAFSYSKQDSFIQEIGFFFEYTGVKITNTGATVVKLTSPDFDLQLANGESHSFGMHSDWASSESRVVQLWKTMKTGIRSCTSYWTTENRRPNETIRVFEFGITEVRDSDTSSTMPDNNIITFEDSSTTTSIMPDNNTITSENSSTTTSTMPDPIGTTFQESSATVQPNASKDETDHYKTTQE